MSIGPEQSLGDAFVRVGFDTSKMNAEERDILKRVEALKKRADAIMGRGGGRGPGGGGGGGMAPATVAARPRPGRAGAESEDKATVNAVNRAAGGIISAIHSTGRPVPGAIRSMQSAVVRSLDANIDKLSHVAAKLGPVADAATSQMKMANDIRRYGQQGAGRAALNRRFNSIGGLFGQDFGLNTDPNQKFSKLAPETRAFGFGPGFEKKKTAQSAPLVTANVQAAAVAAPAVKASNEYAEFIAREAAEAMAKKVAEAKAEAERLIVGAETKLNKDGSIRKGSARKIPTPAFTEYQDVNPPGFGVVADRTSGNFQRQKRRSGSLDPAIGGFVGRVAGGAGILGGAAAGGLALGKAGVGGGLASGINPAALAGLLPILKAIAPAAGVASVAILGVGNSINLVKAPFREAGNRIREFEKSVKGFKYDPLVRAFGGVGKAVASGITFPFRLALRGMGLFDSRASMVTNSLRLMGKVARGMRFTLGIPFKTALGPLTLFSTNLKSSIAMLGLLGPIGAGAGLMKMVMQADALQAAGSRVEMAFHGAGSAIFNLADEMAAKVGAVRQQTLDLAGNMGLLMTGSGIGEGAAAKMSVDLTRLAADMASTFRAPIEEMKSGFMSAMQGSFVPLQKYDILLRQSDVNQRAVAMGLAKTTKEVNFQAKAMATHALIMERGRKFLGGMERNMNTLGALVTEIRGRFANFTTEIGQRLYPAARQLALLIVDLMSGNRATGLLDVIGAIGERVARSIRFVRQMAASFDDVKIIATEVGRAIGENMGEVFQAAMLTAKNVLMKGFEAARYALRAVWDLIGSDLVQTLVSASTKAASKITQDLADAARGLFETDYQTIRKRLEEGRQERARSRASAQKNQEKATQILANLGGVVVLPNILDKEATKAINDAMERIRSRVLRGDDDQSSFAFAKHDTGVSDAVEEGRSRTGSMVSAEQLREMQADRDQGRKQIDILGQIRDNTANLTSPEKAGPANLAATGVTAMIENAKQAASMNRTVRAPDAPGRFRGRSIREHAPEMARAHADQQREQWASPRAVQDKKQDKVEKNTEKLVKVTEKQNRMFEQLLSRPPYAVAAR